MSRLSVFASLGLALISLGVAVSAWLRPFPDSVANSNLAFTDEQAAEAKANICEAYRIVKQSVVTNTHRTNPVPGDNVGALAIGTYDVLALYNGGDYLLDRLAAEPATPDELRDAVKSLGNIMKKLGMMDLAVVSEPISDPVRQSAEEGSRTVDGLCG